MSTLLLALVMTLLQVEGMREQADAAVVVRRIKENQRALDETLLEASEADAVETQIERARRLHLEIIRDLEELIRQAKYQRSNDPSGMPPEPNDPSGSSGQPPPPRPSDGSEQRPPQSTEREDLQSGSQPQAQDGERPQDQPQPAGSPPRSEPASQPPPDETSPFTREDVDGRWGLLPPKVQEDLMNLHVDDVPDRYRTWLEAYIKAMHRLEEP